MSRTDGGRFLQPCGDAAPLPSLRRFPPSTYTVIPIESRIPKPVPLLLVILYNASLPERDKLSAKQVQSVLNSGLHGKWVVVNLADAVILGSATGVIKALRDAKAKDPTMDLDDVAIMMVAHRSRPRRSRIGW